MSNLIANIDISKIFICIIISYIDERKYTHINIYVFLLDLTGLSGSHTSQCSIPRQVRGNEKNY